MAYFWLAPYSSLLFVKNASLALVKRRGQKRPVRQKR